MFKDAAVTHSFKPIFIASLFVTYASDYVMDVLESRCNRADAVSSLAVGSGGVYLKDLMYYIIIFLSLSVSVRQDDYFKTKDAHDG